MNIPLFNCDLDQKYYNYHYLIYYKYPSKDVARQYP